MQKLHKRVVWLMKTFSLKGKKIYLCLGEWVEGHYISARQVAEMYDLNIQNQEVILIDEPIATKLKSLKLHTIKVLKPKRRIKNVRTSYKKPL